MDAMKNATDFDDEEIIDLTDIIEKGAAPAHKGGDPLDDQLSDLNSTSSEDDHASIDLDMDADIDALLAQMGGDPSESTPESAIPGMGQERAHNQDVNPDETLDMPGMAEVDSLLQDLDMPPQPDSSQSSAPNALGEFDNSPAAPASAVELDALLDGMLEGSSTPHPAPTPKADQTSDLDSALTADLDDLDALLGADSPAAAPSSPATAAAPAGPDLSLDDLDALLGTDALAPAAAPVPHPVGAGTPQPLDVADLDALLGQPNVPVSADPSYVPDVGDLASLDALLGAGTASAQEPSLDTLNMLKNFDDTPNAPQAADTPVPTLAEDLMALDVMLNTKAAENEDILAETVPAEPHITTTRELMDSAPAADEGLLADLDALLSGAPQDTPSPAEDTLPGEATALAESGDTWRDPLPGFGADEIQPNDSAMDNLLVDIDPQELNRAAQELLDEKVMLEATVGDVDTSAWLSSLDEALDEEEAQNRTGDLNKTGLNEANLTDGETFPPATDALEDILSPAASNDEGPLPEGISLLSEDAAVLSEGIVPSLHGEDEDAGLPEGIVPPMPLAAAAALGATAVAMATRTNTPASVAPAIASPADAALSEEDRARISELEERLMVLEEQWQMREASHRQLLDHMGTQDLHNSERLSALEARLASVQSEAQAETNNRLTQLEFRLDDVINQPAPASAPISAPLSDEEEELRAARLDLMDGRIMVLEDAEEQRCAKEKTAEESLVNALDEVDMADTAEDISAEGLPALHILEERLAALENQTAQGQVELEERLTSLEKQFHEMQSAMEERLEQKAAAAAAKIIREEITALLAE